MTLNNEIPEDCFPNKKQRVRVVNIIFNKGDKDKIVLWYRYKPYEGEPTKWKRYAIMWNSVFAGANHEILDQNFYLHGSEDYFNTCFKVVCEEENMEFKVIVELDFAC